MSCKKCGCEISENMLRCPMCDAKQRNGKKKVKNDESPGTSSLNSHSSGSKSGSINVVATIFAVINAVILIPYNLFLRAPKLLVTGRETTDAEATMLGFYLIIIFMLMVVSLVLHIVGLITSHKQGIPIKGHVLGIVGTIITVASLTVFSFISIILFILSAIFIFRQPNVTSLAKEGNIREKVANSKIKESRKKIINKKNLFWYMVKWNLIFTILAAILWIFLFVWATSSEPANSEDLFDLILLLILYTFIFTTALWHTFIPTRRIFKNISKQEKFLGFSFSDEMEKQGRQSLPIQSSQWFINRHAIYHRDYIAEVKNLSGHHKNRYSSVMIVGKDGTKNCLRVDVFKFLEWVKKINRVDTAEKIRLDRLYEWPQPKGSILTIVFTGFLTALLMWFLVDNGHTLIRRQSLLQEATRTTAVVNRADAGRGRNPSPHIRVSFESSGGQHNQRIRVPLNSVAVGDEIEIYFANEDNCVIMAAERDLSRGHYIYNTVLGSVFALMAGLGFSRNIYALVIDRKIRKSGEDWWSEKVQHSKRKSERTRRLDNFEDQTATSREKQLEQVIGRKQLEKIKAFLLKHNSKISNQTEFPTQYLRESTKVGRILISYESENLDVTVMRFRGRTELVINGFVYEERLVKIEKSYELGGEFLDSKVKFINLNTGWLCYVYILIDDEIVAVGLRQF